MEAETEALHGILDNHFIFCQMLLPSTAGNGLTGGARVCQTRHEVLEGS
jgi:hypothetical protein